MLSFATQAINFLDSIYFLTLKRQWKLILATIHMAHLLVQV